MFVYLLATIFENFIAKQFVLTKISPLKASKVGLGGKKITFSNA